MDNFTPEVREDGTYAFAVHPDGTMTDLVKAERYASMTDGAPKGGTLNIEFTLSERLRFAWRAFRWPHSLRNALHFTQEAKTCAEEMEGNKNFELGGVDLNGDIIEELEKVEELLKFLQDY